jgi:hypothetical protein
MPISFPLYRLLEVFARLAIAYASRAIEKLYGIRSPNT